MPRYSRNPRKAKTEGNGNPVVVNATITEADPELGQVLQTIAEVLKQQNERLTSLTARIEALEANSNRFEKRADLPSLPSIEETEPDDPFAGLKSRLNNSFEMRKNQLRVNLRTGVYERYQGLEHTLKRLIGDTPTEQKLRDNSIVVPEIEAIPYEVAADLTGEAEVQINATYSARARALHEVYKEHTKDLLAMADLPPMPPRVQAVHEFQQARKQRLAATEEAIERNREPLNSPRTIGI